MLQIGFEIFRINLDFRQPHNAVGGHRQFGAHARLFVQVQTLADHLSRRKIGIGRKIEQHGFQMGVVGLTVAAEHIGICIGIDYGTDKVVEALRFVDIHDLALHCERRSVDDRRTVFTDMILEHSRFIDRRSAHAAHIVGFGQHPAAYKIDG